MTCKFCNDTGEQRYWEGRWRDEKAENERLRAALKDCADELEGYVEHHYAKTKDYPSELRRYERDIEPVRKARELIK